MYGLGVNRLGVTNVRGGFTPLALFASGEEGVWYDPSDLTTMLQEDTSAVPAVIGQPVGTILDKSQGLNRGSELVTNGSFAADSDWTKGTGWSISGGVAVADNISGQNLSQAGLGLVTNAVYEVTFTVVTRSSGSVIVRFGGGTPVSSISYNSAGTYTAILRANASNTTLAIRGQGGFTGTVDNVSLKQIEGKHARQTTSDKRPVLARHPEGGIRNLLDYTQEFDDSYWIKGLSSIAANQAAAPDGTTTADELTFSVQYSNIRSPDLITTAGVTATVSVWLKNVDGNTTLRLRGSTSGGTYLQSITITNEWARYTATFTHDGTNDINFALQDGNASNLGNVLIWGAQVEVGSTATRYQHVTDDLRYDITEPFGVSPVYYLAFDGANDCLATSAIDFTGTDSMTVCAGMAKDTLDTAVIAELSGNVTGNQGSFRLAAISTASGLYRFQSRGDGTAQASNASPFGTGTNVLTGIGDISDPVSTIRVDGTQEATNTTTQGAGNYGNHALNVGARNDGEGLSLNGNIYGLIIRGATCTATELTLLEGYIAKKTGVYL